MKIKYLVNGDEIQPPNASDAIHIEFSQVFKKQKRNKQIDKRSKKPMRDKLDIK